MAGEVNIEKLKSALHAAFIESDPEKKKMTRAVVVVYDGRLVGERYAPGFDRNTSLLGWSMSKSVTNALVGILVRQEKLRIRNRRRYRSGKRQGILGRALPWITSCG